MTVADRRLDDVLAPLRDLHLADLLETIARALDSGAEVTPEPWRRTPEGKVAREGFLHVPARDDIEVSLAGLVRRPRVAARRRIPFAPFALTGENGFAMQISPFHWNAAEVSVETRQRMPNWGPLRLWFLEFVQSHYGEEAPDLQGALHGLGDPQRVGGRILFRVDFGSAPLRCVPALIEALAASGAARGAIRAWEDEG